VTATSGTGTVLALSPASLDLGDAAQPGRATISNGGAAAFSWHASTDAAWLTVSPRSGSLARGASVQLTVSVSGAPEGTRSATLRIDAGGATAVSTVTARLDYPPSLVPDTRSVLDAAHPTFGWCPGDRLKLLGTVSDPDGVSTVTAKYVWKASGSTVPSVWQTPMTPESSGKYVSQLIILDAGTYDFSVIAADPAGNTRTGTRRVKIYPPNSTGVCSGGFDGPWQVTP